MLYSQNLASGVQLKNERIAKKKNRKKKKKKADYAKGTDDSADVPHEVSIALEYYDSYATTFKYTGCWCSKKLFGG